MKGTIFVLAGGRMGLKEIVIFLLGYNYSSPFGTPMIIVCMATMVSVTRKCICC